MRGTVYSTGFVTVMLALGLLESPWALLAVPAAALVSASFAAGAVCSVTFMRTWADFVELIVLPMFLFSATFVPAEDYPAALQWVLPLTPLYHGVELLRALTLGDVTARARERRLPGCDDGDLPRAGRPASRQAPAQIEQHSWGGQSGSTSPRMRVPSR